MSIHLNFYLLNVYPSKCLLKDILIAKIAAATRDLKLFSYSEMKAFLPRFSSYVRLHNWIYARQPKQIAQGNVKQICFKQFYYIFSPIKKYLFWQLFFSIHTGKNIGWKFFIQYFFHWKTYFYLFIAIYFYRIIVCQNVKCV